MKNEECFSSEGMVIITSNNEVDAYEWSVYIENNWDSLKQQNAKILVLAGIHGVSSGKLGDADPDLLTDYQRQIDYFTSENEKISNDIKILNIKVLSIFSVRVIRELWVSSELVSQ